MHHSILLRLGLSIASWALLSAAQGAEQARLPFGDSNLATSFRNPLYQGQDPWTMQEGGYYYSSTSGPENPTRIYVSRSRTLLDRGPKVLVYDGTGKQDNIFAPEIHRVQGRWYIYAHAYDMKERDRRHFVWEPESGNPLGTYRITGWIVRRVNGEKLPSANDITVFTSPTDGKLYVIAAGPGGNCIAPMDSPTSVSANFVPIHAIYGEGPRVLIHNGRLFCTAAAGFWRYCNYHITMTEFLGGDLCNPAAWKLLGKVFEPDGEWTHTKNGHFFNKDGDWTHTAYGGKEPANQFIPTKGNMWGTSRASFVKSADGREDWMVYHHKVWPVDENGYRQISIQKFTWNPDGKPNFGVPVQAGTLQEKPSGDPGLGDQYEAEDATRLGAATVNSDHKDYNGKGFVSNLAASGDGVLFSVNVPVAGFHIVTLRYSNGKYVAHEQQYKAKRSDAAPSHLTVYVNGQKIKRTTLDKTRNYDHWMQEAEALKLKAGLNKIEYRLDPGDEGEVALDNLWLYSDPSWPESASLRPRAD
jgi:GH43 family beta-xylosidase